MGVSRIKASDWEKTVVRDTVSIREVASILNETTLGIVLVQGENRELLGVVVDGDIRRGLLTGIDLDSVVSLVMRTNPVIARDGISNDEIEILMRKEGVVQIPVVNDANELEGLVIRDWNRQPPIRSNLFLVMAGGLGERLRPLTEITPKPMLLVHGKPILEHILQNAILEGFRNFVISTGYLGSVIKDYFGDGSQFGISITYIEETKKLGTAGAISLLQNWPDDPIVITNGDILTNVRYASMLDFHLEENGVATMGTAIHESKIEFGVVDVEGTVVQRITEKPIMEFLINAGVYVLSPAVRSFLTTNEYCDMPTLFTQLISNGLRVVAFPFHESWNDIGTRSDLEKISRGLANRTIGTKVQEL